MTVNDADRIGGPFDLHHCGSCGLAIVHTYQGPYLDAVQHLSECTTLRAALADDTVDYDAEDERRERM